MSDQSEPDLRSIRELDETEIRVLGALMEKQQATPDYYPLTVSALIAACNQKSNRDPVTELTETEVVEALERLRRDVLAWRSEGARAERWSQSISRRLELTAASKALLTLLMVRGPQTPGQLRARSGRLHGFAELSEVEATLAEMAAGDAPLAVELPRRLGARESRWAHLLGAEPEAAVSGEEGGEAAAAALRTPPSTARRAAASPPPADPGLSERLAAVERRVAELAEELARLRRELGGS